MRICIIPCGARKSPDPAPPAKLYRGPYHRLCTEYARLHHGTEDIYILSAFYGLLSLADEREWVPYEMKFGQPGAISVELVRHQARQFGLLGAGVTALGGRRYLNVVRAIWPDARTPVPSLGIGHQLQWLRKAVQG